MSSAVLLGIESSCDETSACVLAGGKVRKNVVDSQLSHRAHGGVVPEIASRLHEKRIVGVVEEALAQAGVRKRDLSLVAVTQGPGLMGSLLVGFSFAKALAWSLGIPFVGVNHLRAHIASLFLEPPTPVFPFLCLLVSGGHTQLLRVDAHEDVHLLGQTKDDSVGEAFDKIARLLGLPYPGGAHIDALAAKGDPKKFSFPRPNVPGFDYSFSGLKTSFLYFINAHTAEDANFISTHTPDVAASIQRALVEALLEKLHKAVTDTAIRRVGIVGGVAANAYLRSRLHMLQEKEKWQVFIPSPAYCTDNAAMVAMCALLRLGKGEFSTLSCAPFARQDNTTCRTARQEHSSFHRQ